MLTWVLLSIVPMESPPNLHGYNTSSTSINITWNDITETAWGGRTGGYLLKYESVKDAADAKTIDLM